MRTGNMIKISSFVGAAAITLYLNFAALPLQFGSVFIWQNFSAYTLVSVLYLVSASVGQVLNRAYTFKLLAVL